jgi:acetyltransferase-like isoleucine patch superfamily enzyme
MNMKLTQRIVKGRKGSLARKLKYLIYFCCRILPVAILKVLTEWWPEESHFQRLRGALYRPLLGGCGSHFRLNCRVTMIKPENIHLGRNVLLATGVWLDGSGSLTIEDDVLVGPYCVITSSNHTFIDNCVSKGPLELAHTHIGRGTWLAAHVVVKAGVRIGNGVLVAANAVVTKDIPDNVIAAGVPARVLGPRHDLSNEDSID